MVDTLPGLALVETRLRVQLGPSHIYPGPEEAATNYGSLCSLKQAAQDQSQIEPGLSEHWSTLLVAIKPTTAMVQNTLEHTPIKSISSTYKGRSWQAPDATGMSSAL